MFPGEADALFIYPMFVLVGAMLLISILFFRRVRKMRKNSEISFDQGQLTAFMLLIFVLAMTWLTLSFTYIRRPRGLKIFFDILFVVSTSLQGLTLPGFYLCLSRRKYATQETIAMSDIQN